MVHIKKKNLEKKKKLMLGFASGPVVKIRYHAFTAGGTSWIPG